MIQHSPTPWRFADDPMRGRCILSADNKYVMCEGFGVFGDGDEALLIAAVNDNAELREAVAVLRNKLQISTSFLDLEAASHAGRGDQGKGDTCKRQANANREALAATSRFAEEPTP